MLRRLLRRLSTVLLAPRCLVCAEPGDRGLDLCAACHAALPWNLDACRQCGLPLSGPGTHCGQCQFSPPPYTVTQAAFRYAFPVDRLLPRFKFHGDLAAGAVLATLMQWSLDPAERPDALIPVPLHRVPSAAARLRPGAGAGQGPVAGMSLAAMSRSPRAAARHAGADRTGRRRSPTQCKRCLRPS